MFRHTANLIEWLRRMGVKTDTSPPLGPLLQPVQVVSDVSLLTPQLLPASGMYGDFLSPGVGENSCFQVHSRAAGGTILRYFAMNSNNAVSYGATISNTPLPFATLETVLTERQMGPVPCVSQVKSGSTLNANRVPIIDNPAAYRGARGDFLFTDIYIPTNYYFQASNQTSNVNDCGIIIIQDLPVGPGPQ